MLTTYSVRLFEVSRDLSASPVEVSCSGVKARTVDKARDALRERLKRGGKDVRSISVGPDRSGRDSLIAYIWAGSRRV